MSPTHKILKGGLVYSTLHMEAIGLLVDLSFGDPREQCHHRCCLQWVGSMPPVPPLPSPVSGWIIGLLQGQGA